VIAIVGTNRTCVYPQEGGPIRAFDQGPKGEGEMIRNRILLLGVGIGLFGTLAVFTARYVAAVLAG
jgi:hypothetical protein